MKILNLLLIFVIYSSCNSHKNVNCFALIKKMAKNDPNIIETISGRLAFVEHTVFPELTTLYIMDETDSVKDSKFSFSRSDKLFNMQLVGARGEVFKLQRYGPELTEVLPESEESKLEEYRMTAKKPTPGYTIDRFYLYFLHKLSKGNYKPSKTELEGIDVCMAKTIEERPHLKKFYIKLYK